MKYINADKLIAEIRKLRSESCISESDDYYEYAKSEIIDIIHNLQQEQPEGLDEAIEEHRKELDYMGMPCGYKDASCAGFKAGAEWMAGREKLPKEDEK